MIFTIVMIFNSDGKIMYISETASVHLGLSQVFDKYLCTEKDQHTYNGDFL